MTPTHTNKRGARYRYYISHSALQKRRRGKPLMRVPAKEIEELVVRSTREHLGAQSGEQLAALEDRELIERHVERVIVGCGSINIQIADEGDSDFARPHNESPQSSTIQVAWTKDGIRSDKGILHQPPAAARLSIGQRNLLLKAIAKARGWIDGLAAGRVASFAEIAKREGKVERHIRLLAPLAFVSPQIVSDIAEGSFPPMGVTDLAKAMPYLWADTPFALK